MLHSTKTKFIKQDIVKLSNTSHFMLHRLESESHPQISIWLEHPKAKATGINWWKFRVGAAQLQIKVGQKQEHKSVGRKSSIV